MTAYLEITNKILQLADIDQKTRQKPDVATEEMIAVDTKNRVEMKKIIDAYGLISQSKFGKDASYMAWLLVQHFPPEEIAFMKKYLQLMKENKTEIDIRNIAYLEDRIAMYEGKPQTYGTQITGRNGKLYFHTLKNVRDIDTLRKNMGLVTLREYVQMFKQQVMLPEGYNG